MKTNLIILLSLSFLVITGCSTQEMIPATTAKEMVRTALVAQKKEFEATIPEISLSIVADSNVNSRVSFKSRKENEVPGTPISIKVIELKDDSLLLSADQESLNQDLKSALGQTYLNHSDFVLTPGQFKFIDFEKVNEKTRFIGVIADYRDVNRSSWKKIIKLHPSNKKQSFFLQLTMQEAILKAGG